jgi:hypothetical protein
MLSSTCWRYLLASRMRDAMQTKVAKLLHERLGFDRLVKEEVPAVVYLDEQGRLFTSVVAGDAANTLRFKFVMMNAKGFTYSLLLRHRDLQFTVSHLDGAITFDENGDFSEEDRVLLKRLLRHLETASRRTLVRQSEPKDSLWRRLFGLKRLAVAG